MAILKYSAIEFGALGATAGVTLEYFGKEDKNTAIMFTGSDYTPANNTQGEMLRVIKNVMLAHWLVKDKETTLRADNDGIRTKLRATTPYRIHVYTADNKKVKVYELAQSEWAKIGLMPTAKDLERSLRDKKSYVHKAAVAMLEALDFRLELPKETEATDKANEKEADKILDKVAKDVNKGQKAGQTSERTSAVVAA